jgi:hypothetical protein
MKHRLSSTVLAACLLLGGCVVFPESGRVFRKVPYSPVDFPESPYEAMESIKTVRDQSTFPDEDVSEVEVSNYGFTLKGFKSTTAQSGSTIYPGLWGWQNQWVAATSSSATNAQEKQNIRALWFKDLREIRVFFDQTVRHGGDGVGAKKRLSVSEGYVCLFRTNSGSPLAITSMNRDGAVRFATGVSYLSRVPIQYGFDLGLLGAKFDDGFGVVVLDLEGPLGQAGAKVLWVLKKVDGQSFGDQAALEVYLTESTLTEHVFRFATEGADLDLRVKINNAPPGL